MTAINANMTSSQGWIPLSAADAEAFAPGYYTLGSESVLAEGLHRLGPTVVDGRLRPYVTDGVWCHRGVGGTTKTTHDSGATLTRYYPDAPSGASTLDAVLALSTGEDIADALSGAAAPDATNVFATMADLPAPGGGAAEDVTYDPETSGLTATDVQAAIDEVAAALGGSGLLTDPGNVWEAETAVGLGYRILVPGAGYNGQDTVFEVIVPGTTDTDEPSWGFLDDTIDGEVTWRGLGYPGALPWTAVTSIAARDPITGRMVAFAEVSVNGGIELNVYSPTDQVGELGIDQSGWASPKAADVGAAGTAADIIAALRAAHFMAATPDALAFDQQPTAALVDATITPAPTVQTLDDLGNLCAFDNETWVYVELTIPGAATLGGTLARMAVAGVATFDDLSVDTADTYTLTASSGALTPAVSDPFTISAP